MADISRSYLTFSDVIDHLADYSQGQGQGVQQSILSRCALRAYDEVVHGFEWPFLRGIRRLQAYAAENTGTVDYTQSSKILEITGSTFPTWATKDYGACVYLDGIVNDVESYTDTTHIVLNSNRNPGEDLSDESFTIFCRWYPLPNDFLTTVGPMAESFRQFGTETSYEEIAHLHRFSPLSGDMRSWAIGPNSNTDGAMALHVWPAIDTAVRIDLPYKKRPRDLRHTGHNTNDRKGTITNNATTVTGSNTAFSSTMEGSILRIGSTATPTGLEGQYPYVEELIVDSVASTTSLTLEAAPTTDFSAAPYRVSDPVSLERVAWDAILTCAEKHLARMRSFKGYAQTVANHQHALRMAKEASSTTSTPRTIRGGSRVSIKSYDRLADLA